jgi:hypothetical protein
MVISGRPQRFPSSKTLQFSYFQNYPDPDGFTSNRLIRQRISLNNAFGTATSAIWNITYPECFTSFVPIFISFSFSVLNDQSLIFLGKAKHLKKFPRLYANGVSVEHGKLILNNCPGLGVSKRPRQ